MAVGHGQFGIRSGMRTFRNLQNESVCRKDAFVEIEGGALVSRGAWVNYGGDAWQYDWTEEFDGERLDVVGVRTNDQICELRLLHETQVIANPGSFAYDPAEGIIRIHLPDSGDPSGETVLVTTTFGFGTGGQIREHLIHPMLASEMTIDGQMEVNHVPDWDQDIVGLGWLIDGDDDAYNGWRSAIIENDGSDVGSAFMKQTHDVYAGSRYRLFGYYKTPLHQPASATTYVAYGDTDFLSDDGINADPSSAYGVAIENTFGEWRAFCYDFIAHEDGAPIWLGLVSTDSFACSVKFDDVSLKPIVGWRNYRPCVAADAMPESEQGSLDVYSGSASTGSGAIKLLNDARSTFERLFSPNPWSFLSREIRILYGGAFRDGQEILRNDLFPGQSGILADQEFLEVTDTHAVVKFEDPRNLFEAEIPSTIYGTTYPDVEERDFSRVRARFFGSQTHIRPARVDVDGATGLGVYEVNDPTYAVANAIHTLTVYAYTDEDAAERNDATKRVTLVDTSDYTKDLALGQFEITRNPGVFVITGGEGPDAQGANDRIDFVANSVTYEAPIDHGIYTAATLRAEIESSMETASGGAFTVTYSNTTHKYNIQWDGAGTFQLLADTGANSQRSTLNTLGYTNATDYTGAGNYTGTTAVFTSADEQSFIRVDCGGYLDDASGTYTGTPSIPVELGPDIFRYIVGVFLREPTWRINEASFVEARTLATPILAAYFGLIASVSDTPAGPITVQGIVDRLEISGAQSGVGMADIVMDGAGVFYWVYRTATALVTLYERDYLSWRGFLNGNDPYGTVRVNYAQDPSTGYVLGVEVTNADTELRDRRYQPRTFDSYLTTKADAEEARDAIAILARAPIRHFHFSVKGRLLTAKPGDIIVLNRSRALAGVGGDGSLTNAEFRILWMKKNYLSQVVECIVHTNVS